MPSKSANVKNEKQYEKLKEKGMSKSRAARIANSPGASSRGGKKSGSGSSPKQGGTTAQTKKAGARGDQFLDPPLPLHAADRRCVRSPFPAALVVGGHGPVGHPGRPVRSDV